MILTARAIRREHDSAGLLRFAGSFYVYADTDRVGRDPGLLRSGGMARGFAGAILAACARRVAGLSSLNGRLSRRPNGHLTHKQAPNTTQAFIAPPN
jgi:hypothetical protein